MDFARVAASQCWQVTALIIVVLVLVRLFARNRPHLAYLLWLVVLVKCVTPPVWSSPSGIFCWIQHAVGTAVPVEPGTAGAITSSPASLSVEISGSEEIDASSGLLLDMGASDTSRAASDLTARQRRHSTFSYGSILVTVWVSGVVAALLVSTVRRWRCARRLRRMPALNLPEFDSLLADLSRMLGISRPVQLLVTTSSIGPAVIGLRRPVIVMPELVIRGKGPQQLSPVVAHELIHVRRGDLWIGLLQVCAKAIWWFYPLVWWASRLSSREAERCCDEEVIAALGCDAKQYARSLLEILELKKSLEPVPSFPGMKPIEVTSQRLERIMSLRQGCHKRTPSWCWAAMLVLGATALPGAAFVAAQSENGDPLGGDVAPVDKAQDYLALPSPYHLRDDEKVGYGEAAREQTTPAEMPILVTTHRSDKVIRALQREFKCSEAEAYQAFANILVREGQLKNSTYSIATRVRIWSGGVKIAASREEHQRMQAAVARMKKHGVSKLALELRFVTAPAQFVEAVIKNWELTPLELGTNPVVAAAYIDTDPIVRPLPTDGSRPRARASWTTTSNLPALYRIVDAGEAERLIETFQQNTRTNLLQAPRLTLFNGQSAKVADQSQRPFVVGLTIVDGDGGRAAQPQVQVVDSGRVVRLRPILRGNKIWLDYDVTASDVGDVKLTTVTPVGFKKPLTLQVPKVHTARIESAVEFDFGETAILGGLPASPARDDHQQLLVMIRAQRVRDLGELSYQFAEAAEMPAVEESGAMQAKLEKTIGLALNGRPLAEALRLIATTAGVDLQLETDGIDVGLLVTLNLTHPVSLRSALKLILEPLHMDFEFDGQRILVTSSEPHYATVYSVNDLAAADLESITPDAFDTREYPSQLDRNLAILATLIHQKISPNCWKEGGGHGTIRPFRTNRSLVVMQTRYVHHGIATFLQQLRRDLGLAAMPAQPDLALPRRNIYSMIYNVADLVMPRPGFLADADQTVAAVADFDALIDRIKLTVAPDSWDDAGASGAIEPFATNLSLVISQSQVVHGQIGELLAQLRSQPTPQVMPEARRHE